MVHLQPGFPINIIDTVIWTPDSGLEFGGTSIQQLLNPTIKGLENQEYTVSLVTTEGCATTASFRLLVKTQRDLYAPNVIWPDGPTGNNAAFTLFTRPGSLDEILELQIYDRWGNQVFQREHFQPDIPQLGWAGDFRNKPMNPAVFVWRAKVESADGTHSILKGDVTVVR